MKQLVVSVAALVACGGGGKQSDSTLVGKAEGGPSVTAMDTLLAQLEAMRPYVVLTKTQDPHQESEADCAAYTADASAALAKVAASTPAAASARTSVAPASVSAWQTSHAPAIEKLIVDVATPFRFTMSCEAIAKDEAWTKVSAAIVAVAQPPTIPAAVTKRRQAMAEISAMGAKISKAECDQLGQTLQAKFGSLDAELKAMSPIERFVDDKVWEEEDEKQAESDPGLKKLFETCGGGM